MFKNNPNFSASEAMKTMDFGNDKGLKDPKSQSRLLENTIDNKIQNQRNWMSKSPLGMNTLNFTENRTFLKPITPM